MTGIFILYGLLAVVIGFCGFLAGRLSCQPLAERTTLGPREERRIWEYLSRLQSLSARIATDVDEHNATLGGIDRELFQVDNQNISTVSGLVERLIAANEIVHTQMREAERTVGEMSSQIEQNARESRTDVLTGLPNRRAFQDEAARFQANCRETKQPFSLVMVDIDHFKQVNDVYGHLFGDEVLAAVARILGDEFRGRDVVTRYGGEEFSVLMPGTTIHDARNVADRVRKIVERTELANGNSSFGVTISLGVAEVLPREEVPALLNRADQTLYAAKQAGRNRVYWHDGFFPQPWDRGRDRTVDGHQRGNDWPVPETRSVQEKPVAAVDNTSALSRPVPEITTNENMNSLRTSDVDMEVLKDIGNKTLFCQDIRRRIAQFERDGSAFVTILLGIENSDKIIRSHGEAAWQVVRSVVVQVIREQIREMDVVAAYGDSTFGVLLPDRSLNQAVCVSERVREAIQQIIFQEKGGVFQVTISGSVVQVEKGDHMERLLKRAGQKLEEVQKGGGNRTSFSPDTMVVL